jgi:putative transposase
MEHARIGIPAFTHHIIQRSRRNCFSCAPDRLAYLDSLTVFAPHYDCALHAYVLMANHVHLLLTSGPQEALAFVQAIWSEEREIRPVREKRYLLACMRYIELNPVRARIVARPQEYRWSSYRANALGYVDPIVTPHALYCALGRSPEQRRSAYAAFVRRGFARPDRVSP